MLLGVIFIAAAAMAGWVLTKMSLENYAHGEEPRWLSTLNKVLLFLSSIMFFVGLALAVGYLIGYDMG